VTALGSSPSSGCWRSPHRPSTAGWRSSVAPTGEPWTTRCCWARSVRFTSAPAAPTGRQGARPATPRRVRVSRKRVVRLVPCVFTWPTLIVECCKVDQPSLTYPPRGVAELWVESPAEQPTRCAPWSAGPGPGYWRRWACRGPPPSSPGSSTSARPRSASTSRSSKTLRWSPRGGADGWCSTSGPRPPPRCWRRSGRTRPPADRSAGSRSIAARRVTGRAAAPNQAEYSKQHVHQLRLIRVLTEVEASGCARSGGAGHNRRRPGAGTPAARRRHAALAPMPDADEPPLDLASARAEVDRFVQEFGWRVGPQASARSRLAQEHRSALRCSGRGRRPAPPASGPWSGLRPPS